METQARARHTNAVHRFKLDIGGAEAGARGVAISSSSSASACGGVPSSSSSDSLAVAHTGGSGVMCFAKISSRAWSAAASITIEVLGGTRRHSADNCGRHALFTTTSSNETSSTEQASFDEPAPGRSS